jgi:hypothetical protein
LVGETGGSPTLDIEAQIARIRLAQEETRKAQEETRKFVAEQHKLQAEGDRFKRETLLAPVIEAVALVGGVLGAATFLAKFVP